MKRKYESIKKRMATVAISCGRDPGSINLVAVSKTKPAEAVIEALDSGITTFGENYIQEARQKIEALSSYPATWHFIGHLQSNKSKYAVRLFDLIHTVDSVKLATELDRQAGKIGKIQDILLQVNTGGEATKSGARPEAVHNLAETICRFDHIRIRGLMTIPPLYNEPEKVAPYFRTLREIADQLSAAALPKTTMKELSMGMTGDFETAIREGATLIRIGTALFGERA